MYEYRVTTADSETPAIDYYDAMLKRRYEDMMRDRFMKAKLEKMRRDALDNEKALDNE